MKIVLTRKEFEHLDHDTLAWSCIAHIAQALRGKDPETKNEVYRWLSPGQQAAFLFYAFHNHIHSPAEIYGFTVYFIADLQSWPALKGHVAGLEDPRMTEIYSRLELLAESSNRLPDGSWKDADLSDLERNGELASTAAELYEKYTAAAPHTIALINAYVQCNPEEFVRWE